MDERKLLEKLETPFSLPVMFTCTYEARMGNINRSHRELTQLLGPLVSRSNGVVKALNSNYGHYCQPGYENFLKHPKLVKKRTTSRLGNRGVAAPRKQRKPQGDGTCFNSALEVTIIPDADTAPPAIQKILENNPSKHYAVKSFPTTGQTQVPGVISPDLVDGTYVAQLWAKFLSGARVGSDPDKAVTIISERPIMMNYKFHLLRKSERIILNLQGIVDYLEGLKTGSDLLPYPIREIKSPQDSQNLSFKCVCPTHSTDYKNGVKKVRVNVFHRGKINILGASDAKSSLAIYDFLAALMRRKWSEFVNLQPLPDNAKATRVEPPSAPDYTIAPEQLLSDESLDDLLVNEFLPRQKAKKPPLPDLDKIMLIAAEFSREYGDSEGADLDELQRACVEENQEDSLKNHPE